MQLVEYTKAVTAGEAEMGWGRLTFLAKLRLPTIARPIIEVAVIEPHPSAGFTVPGAGFEPALCEETGLPLLTGDISPWLVVPVRRVCGTGAELRFRNQQGRHTYVVIRQSVHQSIE